MRTMSRSRTTTSLTPRRREVARSRLPAHRPPTHPGEMLLEEFIRPLGLTQTDFAARLRVSFPRLNEIIRGKRGISGDTALRLGRWFGTGPDIWMNLQKNYELRLAAEAIGEGLQKIPQRQSKAKEMKQQGDNSPPQP